MMAKEICISSTPHETRLAILEDDQLAEIYYERENEYTLAGSIYNGRVTRVLPGMQSAFVDIGLERDAFLYVTDFLELEDSEETDEIEKAAITGKSPIHQVRSGAAAPAAAPQQQEEPRSGRGRQRDRRQATPAAVPQRVEQEELVEETMPARAANAQQDDTEDGQGARRWRGRRRRRGARGSSEVETETRETPQATETQGTFVLTSSDDFEETTSAPVKQREIQPQEEHTTPHTRSAKTHMPAHFVLPGESLSKYGGGGAPEEEKAAAEPRKPAPRAVTSRPSTLIESPIEWDGSGLLPGESLSRRRNRQAEQETAPVVGHLEATEEEILEEESLHAEGSPQASLHLSEEFETEEHLETEEVELDRAASHNVDPLPPTGFRLFGFGRKKKEEEQPKVEQAPASTYAPGKGHLEVETIDDEEYVAKPHRQGRKEVQNFDDLEEEMLHSAHFAQPATSDDEEEGEPTAYPRRERNQRGRRGRNASEPRSGQPGGRRGPSRRSVQATELPIISDLLKPGQEILVQIAKEPIAQKGARITSHIALPGRFLVFMPTVSHIGVSRKITADSERQRLKRILLSERGDASGGFIVRTAAEGVSEDELRADLRFLIHLWEEIKQRSEGSKSPALIYHDLSLIERILRDQVSANFSSIWVDSEADYERIVRFLNRFAPSMVRRVKMYTKETPLFEHFGIQDEISKALRSKVWLKSGGSIVINQTEALVAIDINTGKYVGKSARLEDTILKTNLDAVPEIVRQIRLRDLGGIIVIDFIDMDERKNRFKVMAALEEALKSDRAPTKVLQFNDFGLVAITRKRVKQSLERTLSVPCPTCQATGMVKSPTTVCNEIYTELRKMKRHFEGKDILLRVNPETVKVLKANSGSWISEFEELVGRNVLIKSDPALNPEQFDIQG